MSSHRRYDFIFAISSLVTAIATLGSAIALSLIALRSANIQEDLAKLSFPWPQIEFKLPAEIHFEQTDLPFPPYNVTFRSDLSVAMSVDGFSASNIVLKSVKIRFLGFSEPGMVSRYFQPRFTTRWHQGKACELVPDASNRIHTTCNFFIDIDLGAQDPSYVDHKEPVRILLGLDILWMESKVGREHLSQVQSVAVAKRVLLEH